MKAAVTEALNDAYVTLNVWVWVDSNSLTEKNSDIFAGGVLTYLPPTVKTIGLVR